MENYKDDIEHIFDKTSRIEAKEYPELNGSDDVFDKTKEEFVNKPEQHKRIKYGFYQSNIISQLRPKATHLFNIILFNTDKWQKTFIKNKKLSQLSGLAIREISKGNKGNDSLLNELEYWHLINRHNAPNPWNPKKKNRCITVQRWDTALELLKKEGKVIIIDESGKVMARPNPFNN